MRVVALIPARFSSSRFPGKPLVPLLGKPMVIWVAEVAAKAIGKENVFVATDNSTIEAAVTEWGFSVIMTSSQCLTGTDRLAEAAAKIDADIFINVQGDEPLVSFSDIRKIAEYKISNFDVVINGFCYLDASEDPSNLNIPKVLTNEQDELVYMSRLPLPGYKDKKNAPRRYKKQVCIYAFSRSELEAFGEFSRKSRLEQAEDIEILRFLELGIKVHMIKTMPGSLAVDRPEDVELVEAEMRNRGFIEYAN